MLTVLTVEEALEKVLNLAHVPLACDVIPLSQGLGRVLAEDIVSPEASPPFSRATMDGFAVAAQDTFGASESMPSLLYVKGQVKMGEVPKYSLASGEAVRIATGGMLPPKADAVVMLEYTDFVGNEIAVYRPVAPGENVIRAGEDYQPNDLVLARGHKLRPQDLGILASLGVEEIKVRRKPRVAIISTGDELVEPAKNPAPGQIRDVNSTALGALVRQAGGVPVFLGIVPDNEDLLRQAILKGISMAELVVISGGSSVGARDYTAKIIDSLEGEGVLFHGLSIRPGKPLIFGFSKGKAIFGLSGNPVSAQLSFRLLVLPYIRQLKGQTPVEKYPRKVVATLSRNLSSPGGRQDYVRVALVNENQLLKAEPIFGGSGLLRTMVQADGYIVIPRESEGLTAGEKVEVFIFE